MRRKINLKNTLLSPLPPFQALPLPHQQHWETGDEHSGQLIMSCSAAAQGDDTLPRSSVETVNPNTKIVPFIHCIYGGVNIDTHQWAKNQKNKKSKKHYCFPLLSFLVSNKLNLTYTEKKNSNNYCPISSAKSFLCEKFNLLCFRSFYSFGLQKFSYT